MEQAPNLEAQARLVIDQAESCLAMPDQIQLRQHYQCYLGGNYLLELRATAASGTGHEVLDGTRRYIYISEAAQIDQPSLLFSLELNALTGRKIIDGFSDNRFAVMAAAQETLQALTSEKQLLHYLLRVLEYEDAPEVPDTVAMPLDTAFGQLITQGSNLTAKDLVRYHQDGTKVVASSKTVEGSLQHLLPDDLMQPRLRISVARPNERDHTVLEETREGRLESYREIADELERLASQAKPEDVQRDEQGNIMGVSGFLPDEWAVTAAARAMGLRNLNLEQVQLAEKYVRATLKV